MKDIRLEADGVGMVNGQLFTMKGTGTGSVSQGVLGLSWELSEVPDGFSIYCVALYTGCCSTPTFAIEQNGGVNMLTLAKGRYHCIRTFDCGEYGTYNYSYDINTVGDQMTSKGVVHGELHLPRITGIKQNLVEIMYPVSPREVRSFIEAKLFAEDGSEIPVAIHGQYTPLDASDPDWHCCASCGKTQIRRTYINDLEAEGVHLSLNYKTLIKGIDAPDFPVSESQTLFAD